MLNFYQKFLHGAAVVLAPLTDTLRGPGKSLAWSPALDPAFCCAKELLTSVPELMHSCPGAQISLAVDASDSHVGSVLQQLLDGSWALRAFFSKKLSAAEQKYSAFDRELLAAYSSLRHFRFFLEGREFTIFTDHKPLSQPSTVSVPVPGPTESSLVSPPPSTMPLPVLSDPVLSSYNFRCFFALQLTCSSVSEMSSSPSLSLFSVPFGESSLLCDVSSKFLHPFCLWNSVEICLSYFTVPLILVSGHLEDFSQLTSCGLDFPETWIFGLVPVSISRGVRSSLMFMLLFLPSLCFPDVSPTFIWISWALFLLVMVSPIFSP